MTLENADTIDAHTLAHESGAHAGLDHRALFYRCEQEYLDGAQEFVMAGLAAGEPAMVAVPGSALGRLRDRLGAAAASVELVDMTELGHNPTRIIPAVHTFAAQHPGRRLRFIGEPIWPARRPEEVREATRHEALINVAFAGTPLSVLCPYDAARLDPAVIADAECTHPVLSDDRGSRASTSYAGADALPGGCDRPLAPPPDHAATHAFVAPEDVAGLRHLVAEHADRAGLEHSRRCDLVLAVGELLTNTIIHARTHGSLSIWRDDDRLVCQVRDWGRIADPLAGRRIPGVDSAGGRGLWIVNQICDLTELRFHPDGTTIRLHLRA